jgi:hypothetical protein
MENEMGEHVTRIKISEMCIKLYFETANGGNFLEDLEIDERMILKWIIKNYGGNVDWIHLAQY